MEMQESHSTGLLQVIECICYPRMIDQKTGVHTPAAGEWGQGDLPGP